MSWRTVVGGGQVTVGVTAQVSKSASLVGAVPPELHYLVYWILEPLPGPATALATQPGWGTHSWGPPDMKRQSLPGHLILSLLGPRPFLAPLNF